MPFLDENFYIFSLKLKDEKDNIYKSDEILKYYSTVIKEKQNYMKNNSSMMLKRAIKTAMQSIWFLNE